MQLVISNIPEEADIRCFRKCIASALYQMCGQRKKFKVRKYIIRGQIKGRLIMKDADHKIEDGLVNRRFPVYCLQNLLVIRPGRIENALDHSWDLKQVEGIHDEDVASDYEPDQGGSHTLYIDQLSCGAWDSQGHYVDAWRTRSKGGFDSVSINEDRGHLSIDFPTRSVCINLYDIKYTIADAAQSHYYLILRGLPIFIEHTERRSIRVTDFGKEHSACAKYSFVYRVRFVSGLNGFLRCHSRRLIAPDQLRIETSPIGILTTKRLEEDIDALYRSLPFDTAFQIQALVTSWQVMPVEVSVLRDVFLQLGETTGAARIRSLAREIKWRDPRPNMQKNISIAEISEILISDPLQRQIRRLENQEVTPDVRARLAFYGRYQEKTEQDGVFIHSVIISPAGMQLSGPHQDQGNRILRKYPGLDNQYLRVSFQDEMGESIKSRRDIDNESKVIYGKFKRILEEGIVVAGVRFVFLAFSNSQLKSHSCWFVRSPLVVDGSKMITAPMIRDSIGTAIRCPPRFAARLGQAFTTTMYSIKLPRSQVIEIEDKMSNCGRYNFSDGVGKISPAMVALLNAASHTNGRRPKGRMANVFQIRLDGAKGVLALDTRIQGRQVQLRRSMIKFKSRDAVCELAVAKADTVPGNCYLNRPLIALLESLGVPYKSFKRLQDQALRQLEAASRTPRGAARVLQDLGLGIATRASSMLKTLETDFGYDIDDLMAIPFLRDVIRTALFHSLRSIKYKARIPIRNAYTLMGIMDETGTLQEGEVYVCLREADGSRRFLKGPVLVFRSPTLHPGDVQMPEAIGGVRQSSPLFILTNCVVFSSIGTRPLPSMLAGGDLDGDLYSVVEESLLFPPNLHPPATYLSVPPVNIDRPVEIKDITDFFLGYILSDSIGMIANKHLTASDQSKEGVMAPPCRVLAELYNTALDYPKTGVLPDMSKVPRVFGKPDYMESEYRSEERSQGRFDLLTLLERPEGNIYRSQKSLGHLFRSIEVTSLVSRWGLNKDGNSQDQGHWQMTLLEHLKPLNNGWTRFLPYHRQLVEFYYNEEENLASGYYTGGRTDSLSSAEVFLGCTVLKSPYQSRKQMFELTESLKLNYRDLVRQFLQAASSPPGVEEDEEGVLADYLQRTQLDRDLEEDGYDEDFDQFEVDTQASWSTSSGGTSMTDDNCTRYSQYGEERKAADLYHSLYSLFHASLDVPTEDPSKMSCSWIVFPRLVAARRNFLRLYGDHIVYEMSVNGL